MFSIKISGRQLQLFSYLQRWSSMHLHSICLESTKTINKTAESRVDAFQIKPTLITMTQEEVDRLGLQFWNYFRPRHSTLMHTHKYYFQLYFLLLWFYTFYTFCPLKDTTNRTMLLLLILIHNVNKEFFFIVVLD